MIDKSKVLADRQGRQFAGVISDPNAPVQQLLDFVNGFGTWMSFVTIHLSLPALAAIVRKFEQVDEVKKYFSTRNPREAWRFKQFMGVVVRMKMQEENCITTGMKGYLHTSNWIIKSEIYEPTPKHPEYKIWELGQGTRKAA